jgi:uncharacterized protein (DUF849 family)
VNGSDFLQLIDSTAEQLQRLTATKGAEYANSENQLANFKRLGKRLGLKPEAVILVYLTKHLDAIDSYVRTGRVHSEPIEGRIDDAILYLILLKASIREADLLPGVPDPKG